MNIPEDAMKQLDEPALEQRRSYRQQGPIGPGPDPQLQYGVQYGAPQQPPATYGNGRGMMSTEMTEDDEEQAGPDGYVPIYPDDGEIFPGGPYESQVLSWRKQFGGELYLVEIGEGVYIFRTLNRFEYKEIVGEPNTDPLMREELICECCTLYPPNMTWQALAGGKAGTPARLAEQILEKSDFTRDIKIRPL